MSIATRPPRTLTLSEIEARNRQDWPVGAVACPQCGGSGGDFSQHERCGDCRGFGYLGPEEARAVAAHLAAIFRRTAAASLVDSDKTAGA